MSSRKTKRTYIYGLKDPRDGLIHYIGKSDRPSRRLAAHMRDRRVNPDKIAWLKEIAETGQRPELVILCEAGLGDWQDLECLWIARGKAQGWPLTNLVAGGGGGQEPRFRFFDGYLSPEDRARFDELPVMQRWEICRETGRAMYEATKVIVARKAGGQMELVALCESEKFETGRMAAHRLVQQT